MLSWPGDTPADKMPNCKYKLEKSLIEETTGEKRPMVLSEAFQVIECTWDRSMDGAESDKPGITTGYEGPYHDFNGITSQFGAHFILKVDKILMKEKYKQAIINGVRAKEMHSYEEIACMCFDAAGKDVILKFSKWTLSEEMVGDVKYGDMSFKEYISELYKIIIVFW